VEDFMPTRPVESTHEAEPNHPVQERHAGAPDAQSLRGGVDAAGVESPSEDQLQGASAGLPHAGNADDVSSGDQDIDTAGTAHDDLSPTKSL
jgi:hypothetical protein